MIGPAGNGLRICWNDLEFGKWRILPESRTKQQRDNHCATLVVVCYRSSHFGTVAIVRSYEVRTDQQQDDIGALQVLVQFFFPLDASIQVGIAPDRDLALALPLAPLEKPPLRRKIIPVCWSFQGEIPGCCGAFLPNVRLAETTCPLRYESHLLP